jgi:hypothetical protein
MSRASYFWFSISPETRNKVWSFLPPKGKEKVSYLVVMNSLKPNKPIMNKQENLKALKDLLQTLLDCVSDVAAEKLEQKGNSPDECQKVCILNAIKKVEHCIDGIEEGDLKE